ncbi:MAG: DMT family transporter [Rhodobiaceae bacterium]|nr:DMT family transporter [Rhodobiaceae bacterium]
MKEPTSGRWWQSAYLLLTVTTLGWGGNAVAGRLAAGTVPPMTLTAVRWIATAIIFYLIARPMLPAAMPILRERWRYLLLLGAAGFAGFNMVLYLALNFTTAINATILQSGMPMMIMLGMVIVFGERAHPLQIVGAIIAIVGVLYVACGGDPQRLYTLDLNAGDAIMLIALLLYAGYSVGLKKRPALPWQVQMFALTLGASIASIPPFIVEFALGYRVDAGWPALAIIAYTVLIPSVVSQTFFMRAVDLIGAGRAGLFINLVPVFGAGLAVLILGERFQLFHGIGLALVITGIALSEIVARRA